MNYWQWVKNTTLRPRFLVTILAFFAGGVSLYTDPDHGLATLMGGVSLTQIFWALFLAHLCRKLLCDYPGFDLGETMQNANGHPIGSGLVTLAVMILFSVLLLVFASRAHAGQYIPQGFYTYGQTLKAEQQQYWPDHPSPYHLAGLVEQESCVSLKSSKCWNPRARLKTSREEGAGMGQITRAWKNGQLRFDALADLRDRYDELSNMSWGNIYGRPDLQLRALVLMSRDAARPFVQAEDALMFGDAGYNGGVSGVQRERRACKMTKGCDPGRWFGNVEYTCLKSKRALYGGRSACDINREHVRAVFKVRSGKYADAWAAL